MVNCDICNKKLTKKEEDEGFNGDMYEGTHCIKCWIELTHEEFREQVKKEFEGYE